MKAALLALALLSGAAGHATIHDPQNILPLVHQYLGETAFQDAYRCNDAAQIDAYRLSCNGYEATDSYISCTCNDVADPKGIRVRRLVYNCSADKVSFLIDKTGDSTDLLRTDWDAGHQNVGEIFLTQIPTFTGYLKAEVMLTSSETVQFTLGRDSDHPYAVPALNVFGQLGEPDKKSYTFVVTFVKDLPAVAQVVRFRMDDVSWFKIDGSERTSYAKP